MGRFIVDGYWMYKYIHDENKRLDLHDRVLNGCLSESRIGARKCFEKATRSISEAKSDRTGRLARKETRIECWKPAEHYCIKIRTALEADGAPPKRRGERGEAGRL